MSSELNRIEIDNVIPHDLTDKELIVWGVNNTTVTLLGTTTIDVVSRGILFHVARWNLVELETTKSLLLLWTPITVCIEWDNNRPITSYDEWLMFLSHVMLSPVNLD